MGNIAKCEKHGVRIEDIERAFSHPIHVLEDPTHSDFEDRFIAIGRTFDGRRIFVGFTFRRGEIGFLIRPITRFMHKREVEKYEKAIAQIEDR